MVFMMPLIRGLKNQLEKLLGFLNSDDTFFDSTSLNIISDSFDDNTDCIFERFNLY